MAQVGIREYDAKKMLFPEWRGVLVNPETDLKELASLYPWIAKKRLVVKPDQLFGKRGKRNLVALNIDLDGAVNFIKSKRNKEVDIGKTKGVLTHFLIEPFVPHKEEYYLAITSEREGDRIFFSREGGVEIEEGWQDKVRSFFVPILTGLDTELMCSDLKIQNSKIKNQNKNLKFKIEKNRFKNFNGDQVILCFIAQLYELFKEYHFTYLEINPFTISDGKVILLDMVAKVDSTAQFECVEKWGNLEFPAPFGSSLRKEEQFVKELDEKTGASLKLTILNPEGRIWTMVAGGGASVIFADTICDLGYQKELAIYGEYSGDPSKEDTYFYAKTILQLLLKKKTLKGKVLFIAGGIANFTDVAKTFEGIIQALEEYKSKLKAHNVKIFVRRGGPNFELGLKNMKMFSEKAGIKMQVYGPETHMTHIVSKVF